MVGTLIGAGASIALSAINNALAGSQAEKDRQANYYLNEKAAQYADARTRALYNDLYSPQALINQYKAAGLSPSLMFGGTPGQGGIAGAQSQGSQGLQTQYMPITMLEGAQIAAIQAQTEKTKAETEYIKPTSEANIAKTLAEAGYNEAATAATEATAANAKLDNYIKEATKNFSIYEAASLAEKAAAEAEKMYHEMRSAKVLANTDEELFETKVKEGKKQLELLAEQILNTRSNTKLTEEQKRKVKVDMLNSIDEMNLKWKELGIKQQQTTSYAEWIEAQIPYIEKQLEIKFKELKIQGWKVAVDGVTNTIKAIAIGAAAASQFQKGETTPMPAMGGSVGLPYN